jgi:hypothetical protein
MIGTNLLCASQQGYEIEFALLIGVMCHVMNAFQVGNIFILYLVCNTILHPLENIYIVNTN